MAKMIKCDCCGNEKNLNSGSPAFYILNAKRDTNLQRSILEVDICESCYSEVLKTLSLKGNSNGE